MRFELAVAFKYLIPRKKHFSASVISLLSIGIVALVVWLSIVFLSVMKGIETKWTKDMVFLSSPIKITPSEDYLNSYYYQIDSVSLTSGYQSKTLKQKLLSEITDPYNPQIDYELPDDFPLRSFSQEKECRDLVKDSWRTFLNICTKYHGTLSIYQTGVANFNFIQNSLDKMNYVGLFAYLMSYDLRHRQLVEPYSFQEELIYQDILVKNKDLLEKSSFNIDKQPSHEILMSLFPEEAILLPKSFKDAGLHVGIRGEISFYSLGMHGLEEHTKEVMVSGFYNPGLSPIGNKTIFTSDDLLSQVNFSNTHISSFSENGIHLDVPLKLVSKIKEELILSLEKERLDNFWNITSFFENENFKPILDQINSDKLLFSSIAVIIITVACSNIVTMLLLLVYNKRKEIGILISMGASKLNLITIFGFCGFITGLAGFLLGATLSFVTLKYLEKVLMLFNFLQGRKAFSSELFRNLSTHLSWELLVFIGGITLIFSTLSGIIPVLGISRAKISEILKSS